MRALPYTRFALWFLVILTVVRIGVVFATPTELGPDEAQYWLWSQHLAWGYSSKPPMIAWLIALTTHFGGDGEAWIRLSAPILHAGTALVVMALAQRLYGTAAGLWAVLIYSLMPGVQLSAGLISTDAPLLLFWSLGLWFYLNLRERGRISDAIGLGVALGLATLSKYAAVYFLLGVALDVARHRTVRRTVEGGSWTALFLAFAIVIAPNLIWNAQHGFAALAHTADNANWGAKQLFNFKEALSFAGEQFGVFGPIPFVLLLWALLTRARPEHRWLKGFIWPVLLLVLVQAFISRAHANWAGVAYAAAPVLVAGLIVERRWRSLPALGLGVQGVMGIALIICVLSPSFADTIGAGKSFKRARGWAETAAAVAAAQKVNGPFTAVACDNRLTFNELAYYGRNLGVTPLRMWLKDGAHNHAERFAPLTAANGQRVLVVSVRPDYAADLKADFKTLTLLENRKIPLAPNTTRDIQFYAGEGFSHAAP